MSYSAKRFLSSLMIVSLLLVPIGCQQGEPESAEDTKHESPEAVYAAAKKALEAKDYTTFGNCLAPKSQEMIAGGMVMGSMMMKAFGGMAAGFGQMGEGLSEEEAAKAEAKMDEMKANMEKIDKILEKHGITESSFEGMTETGSRAEAMAQVAAPIEDKVAFLSEIIQVFESLEEGEDSGPSDMLGDTLKDLQVSGDTATATMIRNENGEETPEPIEFIKVDGRWLIQISEEAFDMGGDPSGSPGMETGPEMEFPEMDFPEMEFPDTPVVPTPE